MSGRVVTGKGKELGVGGLSRRKVTSMGGILGQLGVGGFTMIDY